MKKDRKQELKLSAAFLVLAAVAAAVVFALCLNGGIQSGDTEYIQGSAEEIIKKYADKHGIDYGEYPESLIELLERNGETKDFVLKYPEEHGKNHKVDMSEYKDSETVPLFMQWDGRWGYIEYSGEPAGLTGCGPVCLSMAAYYLTKSPDMSPDKIIEFACDNGYELKGKQGKGSSWTLISEGGRKLGFDVTELPLDKNRIIKNLEAGNPIICSMGPGDFTSSGHFIVLTGYSDGELSVNDPNSYKNSERKWTYDE